MSSCQNRENQTARDVTGFCAFSPPGNQAIFSIFWGDSLETLRKRNETNPLEKNIKNPMETAARNCRFLSLVVVKCVLIMYPL